jgi:hypothetical protein
MVKNLIYWIGLGLVYVTLAIIFTWPLAKNFQTAIVGQSDFTDGPFFLWNLWWVNKSILTGANPFFSTFIYFPAQANLTLHTLTLTSGLIAIPLLQLMNLVAAQNTIIIGSLVASALGTAVLVNYLTKSKIPAIISGVIFAFTPNIAGHLMAGHFNLAILWCIPLIVLFFIKTLREDSFTNPVVLGLLLAAQFYLDLQVGSAAMIILFIIFLFNALSGFRKTINLRKGFLYLLVVLPFILIFLAPYTHWTKEFWADRHVEETYNNGDFAIIFGANPLNPISWLKGDFNLLVKTMGSFRESAISLGRIAIIISVLSFAFFRKHLGDKAIFLTMAIVGIVLAAGPSFQFNNQISTNFHLPFYYLAKLPPFNIGVVPTRYIIITTLALAVLAGYFSAGLMDTLKSRHLIWGKILIILVLPAGVFLENYCAPLPMDKLEISPIYQQIAAQKGDFTILPVSPNSHDNFFQTIHNKKMISSGLSRRICHYYSIQYKGLPGIESLINLDVPGVDFSSRDFDAASVKKTFEQFKVKYIIVDRVYHSTNTVERAKSYLGSKLILPIYAEDNKVIVYRTNEDVF